VVESVEVAKGTGSVQYGSDALGGVLNVLTGEPRLATDGSSHWKGRLLSKFMTGNMEKTGRGEIEYSSPKMAVSGGLTLRRFGDLIGGDTTGKQLPSGYPEWAMNVKAKFLLSEKLSLTLAQQNLSQQHVPVYYRMALENFAINEFEKQQRQLQYVRFDYKGNSKWIQAVRIVASRQASDEGRRSQRNGSFVVRKERDKVMTLGATGDVFSKITTIWTANSGVELYWDKVSSSRLDSNSQTAAVKTSRGLYPEGARYANFSLYSLHHVKSGRWLADAGIRFNAFSIRLNDTVSGNVKLTPSAFVWNSGVSYQLFRQHYFYTSYSTGYRAPNVDDLSSLGVVDFRYEVPFFGLRPEHSASLELGYKAAGKSWRGDVAIYRMQLSDLITRVKVEGETMNGYTVYKKENTEKAVIQGVEAEVAWSPLANIDLNGSIAYTYGNNETKQEPLRRIPPINGRLMATWQKAALFASAEFLFAGKQGRLAKGDKEDIRINPMGTPGWQVLNLYGGTRLGRLQCNLGVQNIFDVDYRTHGSGINGVGRSGWISLSLHL
jgi:outer membrane receptor protein involved in Fe transport